MLRAFIRRPYAVLLGTALLVVVLVPGAAPAAESRDLFERAAALARAELEADGVGGLSLGIVSGPELVYASRIPSPTRPGRRSSSSRP